MNTRAKVFILAASAASLLGMSSLSASARIVCNEDGDCWHTPDVYAYPPAVHLEVHPDGWAWKEGERHHAWKEHEGRGYWHGGQWQGF
jgi:hypothetical protein